jgi:DnaJ-class molecular chaperone
MADFYSLLGVGRDATLKDIKDAYRRLARKYHPDVNRDDRRAEETFKQINEAYHVLSSPRTRKDYDEFGANWKHAEQLRQAGAGVGFGGNARSQGGAPGGVEWFESTRGRPFEGFEDLLGRFSFDDGGRRAGAAGTEAGPRVQEVPVEVTLDEAYRGTTRLIAFDREERCAGCSGTGRRGRGVCSSCAGAGLTSRPMRLEVKIPAGIDDAGRVRIRPSEDAEIIFVVSVRPDPTFRRQGADLFTDVEVPFTDAILGGEARVPTISGQVALKIPAATVAGKTFRIAGKGMPRVGGGDPGSLYARVAVTVPKDPSEEERKLIQRLRELRNGTKAT